MEEDGEQFELVEDVQNDEEPMSDEDDQTIEETAAEKEAQYGFELEHGNFNINILQI